MHLKQSLIKMSVNPNKIDLKSATSKAAEKVLPSSVPASETSGKIDFKKATEEALKKKDIGGTEPTPGAETPTSKLPLPLGTFDFDAINQRSGILSQEEAQQQAEQQQIADKSFTDNDATTLNDLLGKHEIFDPNNPFPNARNLAGLGNIPNREPEVSKRPFTKEYEDADLAQKVLQGKIAEIKKVAFNTPGYTEKKQALDKDLAEVENLKKKAWRELTIEGTAPVDAIVRTDESGNLLNKTFNRLLAANPSSAVLGGAKMSMETQDRFNKLPSQFATGLNYLKGIEPVIYERLTNSIAKGEPISETQIASITAQGLDIEQERLRRDMAKAAITAKPDADKLQMMGSEMTQLKNTIDGYEEKVKSLQLSVPEIADYKEKINQYNSLITQAKPLQEKLSAVNNIYTKKAEELANVRKSNLLDNKEVLRSFLSDGIAELGDTFKESKVNDKKGIDVIAGGQNTSLFGHTWNYSDNEIKSFGEQYAKQNGLDPASQQVQDAIKYLQDNEGVMIMQNSIAKSGAIREFSKGLADPIRQTFNSFEDLGKSSAATYAESQSQGSTNVSENRLKREDTGIKGILNDVIKGSGQFLTQAGLMYATSGGIGVLAEGIAGKAGAEMLATAKAANIKPVMAFGDDTANLIVSNALTKVKDPIAVFTSSYAMAYDSNLKQALNYTSDNTLAKRAAAINSAMEGATELFLSPLEIAEGIVHKFSKGQTTDLLKILSDKSLKNDPSKLRQYVEKGVKGILGTAKVAGAEIGEELVSQISDYVTNMYLNPNSESFKNRDLLQEFGTTAYQTGLTMAVPALLNGIGAMRANTFTKGSLMVAAQNRQKMFDAYKKDLAEGKIDQNTFNTNVSLLNTAAQANDELPKKADGTSLNTDEKANYIFSRVTEAVMQKKLNSLDDAAQKQILNKKIVEQQNYRAKILGNEEITTDPSYKVDGNEVSKPDFFRLAVSPESDQYHFEVSGDEEAAAQFKKLSGVDKTEEVPIDQQKAADLELLTTLKGKETIPSFEYDGIIANPDLAYREIADQALGFTRKGDERVPHEFGGQEKQTREKYGDAVVDKAIELYPAEPEKLDFKGLRDDDFALKYFSKEEYKAWSDAEIEKPEDAKQMIKDKKEALSKEVAKDSGITGIEDEEIKRQMQPITDKMADIEREFKNNGFEIDTDYDNEISITDKDGELVDPSEIPDSLKKQAEDYAKATQGLGDFQWKAFYESLQESRKKITGEDTPFEEVKAEQPKVTEGSGGVKEGVHEVVKNNPAISEIGTPQEYSEYLKTIFPDSQLSDIFYHRSNEKFEQFDNSKLNKETGGFFDFAKESGIERYGKNLYAALLNIKKLGKGFELKDGQDGTQSTEMLPNGKEVYSVPDASQIHILGSKADIEGFKKWKSEQPNIKEQEPQPKKSSKLAKFAEKHLSSKNKEDATQKREIEQNGKQQHQGTDELQQREQTNWEHEEEDVLGSQEETGSGDQSEESGPLSEAEIQRHKEVAEKVAALETEKRQKINEITKPEISFEFGIESGDLAKTTEANRQKNQDFKDKLSSLKNIINCLWG